MKARYASTIVVAVLIFFAGYAALFIAPDEKTMHAIQRIFYFHLPSWIAMFTALSVAFVANIAYLATRKSKWDSLGVSAAEVAVVCCTIGLATGPLWAKPVWGIWWTWDARLTTTFILWLLYISYLLLRGLLDDPEKKAVFSAVFGIFAFLDAPLVYVSNRLWRTQHPQPVILGGNRLRSRPHDRQSSSALRHCGHGPDDSCSARPLPARAVAARVRGTSLGA